MNEQEFAKIVGATKLIVLAAVRKNLFERFYDAIDDVVQETYYRAYRGLVNDSFEGKSELSTWLYSIARNESLRMNRKLMREQEKQKLAENTARESEESTESAVIDKMSFFQMMARIPKKYAQVLGMYLEGKSEKEIARELALSAGTVKSRAFRGREMMRQMSGR